MNPMHVLALRSLASIEPPKLTQPALKRFRTAVLTMLEAAGLDTSNIGAQSAASFADTKHHGLLVFYDVAADALRLMAPPLDQIDETTERALDLLNGSIVAEIAHTPIEDVDAAARLMAFIGIGGDDAADLHARFVGPNLHRYDDDFRPPAVDDLAELWGKGIKFYFGGSTHTPSALNGWFDRVWAFGVGWVPRPEAPTKKTAPKKAAAPKKKSAPKKKRR